MVMPEASHSRTLRAADNEPVPEFATFDGLQLHYDVRGDGPAVVLLHSLGFDGDLWSEMGVVDALLDAGRAVVTFDARGHGRSGKPYDSAAYGADAMARDVSALADELCFDTVDLAAYSMGSYVALGVLQAEARVSRAVLGGVGGAVLRTGRPDASLFPPAPDEHEAAAWVLERLPYLRARVERGATDARALVQVLRAGTVPADKDFTGVVAAVLLISGTEDDDPAPLAAAIPGANVLRVEADHASTMNHPNFVPALVSFLCGGEG